MAPLTNFEAFLHEALRWSNWLVLVSGLVICSRNVRLSRHMAWVITGLAAYIGIGVFYLVSPYLQRHELLDGHSVSGLLVLASVGSLVAWSMFFGGLAAVFRDVRDQMRMLAHMADPESPR
jgi:drug/metabolite transporter (DMT)-like permease